MARRRHKARFLCAVLSVAACGSVLRVSGNDAPEAPPQDLLLTPAEEAQATALSHFSRALLLQMEGKEGFDAAAEHYLEALRAVPDSGVILEHLVTPYAMQKQYEPVLDMLLPLAEAHPEASRLALVCAEVLQSQGRDDDAVALLRRALDGTGWAEARVFRELFVLLWRSQRHGEAEALLRTASRQAALRGHFVVEHAAAIFYSALAVTEAEKAKGEKHVRDLERRALDHARQAAAKADSADRESDVLGLAGLLMDREEAELAVSMLAGLRRAEKGGADAILFEAKGLLLLERVEEAAAVLAALTDRAGLQAHVLPEAGRLYAEMEHFPRAAEMYERALLAYPAAVPVRLQLAYLYLRMDEPRKGVATLLPVKALPPSGLRLLGHLYRRMGRNDRALEQLRAAEQAAVEARDTAFFSTDFYLFYATVAEDMKMPEDAIELARKALALDPEDPAVCNFLGYILADHNRDLGVAEALIAKAVAAEPDNDAFLDSLAWVFYRQGRFDAAHEAMNRALQASVGGLDAVILDHAGDICRALGLEVMARWYWEQALEKGAPNAADVRGKLGVAAGESP